MKGFFFVCGVPYSCSADLCGYERCLSVGKLGVYRRVSSWRPEKWAAVVGETVYFVCDFVAIARHLQGEAQAAIKAAEEKLSVAESAVEAALRLAVGYRFYVERCNYPFSCCA